MIVINYTNMEIARELALQSLVDRSIKISKNENGNSTINTKEQHDISMKYRFIIALNISCTVISIHINVYLELSTVRIFSTIISSRRFLMNFLVFS